MIAGALFYYQWHSWRNRLLTRIRRLRQPKYLFGAIVGGAVFLLVYFRTLGRGGRGSPLARKILDSRRNSARHVAGHGAVLAWIFPQLRAALSFTEAEVAFLFPAPVGRKELVHFKLLKMQAVVFFSAIFMALISRSWGAGNLVIRMLGWWIIFSAVNLHLLGSSFARTALLDRGFSNWLRRIVVLAVVAIVAGGTALWVYYTVPPPPTFEGGPMDFHPIGRYIDAVLESGPLPYVLFPFRLVVAPFFAASVAQFFIALGPALLVLGLLYWWVIRSNVAFEEASLSCREKLPNGWRRFARAIGRERANRKKRREARFNCARPVFRRWRYCGKI